MSKNSYVRYNQSIRNKIKSDTYYNRFVARILCSDTLLQLSEDRPKIQTTIAGYCYGCGCTAAVRGASMDDEPILLLGHRDGGGVKWSGKSQCGGHGSLSVDG